MEPYSCIFLLSTSFPRQLSQRYNCFIAPNPGILPIRQTPTMSYCPVDSTGEMHKENHLCYTARTPEEEENRAKSLYLREEVDMCDLFDGGRGVTERT